MAKNNRLARQAIAEDTQKMETGNPDEIVYDGWITLRMRALGYCAEILDNPDSDMMDLHVAIKSKDYIEKL